jgi:hypothetical protein
VKKGLAKCLSFYSESKGIRNQVKHSNYGSFRKVKGDVWNAPEDHGVLCGCSYKMSIKSCPN